MNDTIYLVVGKCGIYSDRTEWIVAWYEKDSDAHEHASAAKAEGLKIADEAAKNDGYPPLDAPNYGRTQLDPFREWYCGGQDYAALDPLHVKWPFPLPEGGAT